MLNWTPASWSRAELQSTKSETPSRPTSRDVAVSMRVMALITAMGVLAREPRAPSRLEEITVEDPGHDEVRHLHSRTELSAACWIC